MQWWEFGLSLGLVLLFFWKIAFTNLILARGDTFLYFYPYWDYRAQNLLAGHLPLWNPFLFMGAPFLANSQAGVLYPLNWPLSYFSAPVAVKLSIVFHVIVAMIGAQLFARRTFGQSAGAALVSATLFALGGYLTAQVEHINQLQGLAWFPWLLLSGAIRDWRLRLASRATLIAFQILAGHTQSVFISLIGLAAYSLITTYPFSLRKSLQSLISHLFFPTLFALLLSAAQLLPTLELSGVSLRSGGLPWREALSFSFDPRLLGRALLPGYSHTLFTEFVVYVGVTGLALAAFGVQRSHRALVLLAWVLVGLGLAFGLFNPLNIALAQIPPFNLFRVPARWLFLFAFGLAMLAGEGYETLTRQPPSQRWRLWIGILPLPFTPLAIGFVAPGETGPLGLPALVDWIGWLAPLGALALVLHVRAFDRWRPLALIAITTGELFIASHTLPFNQPTTPDAYTSVRPAMTQLLITTNQSPSPRFLSMSALQFEPGDLAELKSALDPQLPPKAVFDAIVAIKHKEVLSPNLPLAWGIAAVDGFDGGILPLRDYAEFTQLFTGALSPDGRLRENITAAPDQRLLSLANARYLITDKANDAWIDGVFYDLQFTLTLAAGETFTLAHVPDFQATALGVVAASASGSVRVAGSDGAALHLPLTGNRISFPAPLTPSLITLEGPLTLRGLSLIDERTSAFHTLTLGRYRLVHSGDVKIYENVEVLPRAFVAPEAIIAADDEAARAHMRENDFDPARTVILAGSPETETSKQAAGATAPRPAVRILEYSPERVRLTATGPGYLVLTDAFYPGWSATVDGEPVPILRADIMFRAILLPEGEHAIEFRYQPRSVTVGLWLSGAAWVGMLIVFGLGVWRKSGLTRWRGCL